MIEIGLQIQPGHQTLSVPSENDRDELKNYKPYQIVKAHLMGEINPRSYRQLKLYWACCKAVAENLEGKTPEDVDFDTKITLKHIKAFRVLPNGQTLVEVDSISYARLKHLEACRYFDRAFPVMAKMIGITKDELLKNAEIP